MNKKFQDNIIALFQNQGKTWLFNLPLLVDQFEKKYRLSQLQLLNNLSYHAVYKGLQGQTPVILKLGLDVQSLNREIKALNAFENYGGVKVLGFEDGMILLSCAVPGESLKSYFPLFTLQKLYYNHQNSFF